MSRDDHASSLSSTMGGGAPRPGLSRRAFLRRAAAVAFAFPAAGTLLAACGGQSAPTPTSAPAGATAPAPAGTTAPPPATAAPAGQTASTATPAAARPAAAPGGQAVVSLGEPDTLLSGASRTALAGEIYTFTADGLARFRYPDMEAVPDLAEKWDVSPDGKTYTFALRQGVKWQDGQPFSAQDVKFSFETWAHPKWPGPLSPNLALIEGAAAYKQGQATAISGIAIPDDGHVRFTLTAAVATFLATSATGALLPRHLLQDVSPADVQKSPFARKPVYTGPFMVQSWQTGEGLTFAAFPDAFAGPPKLATLVGRDYPDQTTAINALRTGESQLGFVAPDQFDQFARDPTFRTQQLAGSQGVFLTFDLTNPLFADKRVRQAISHAIDRKGLIAALFRGKADPSFGVASPLSWLYNPDAPRFDFDVAQAKQLLDAAGWQPGADGIRAKDGKKFSFT
ncbi:MAG TPA: ABC transporter substrate-binding protein, partial [Thermomicrobiales bacterium]|nr:ABC transporter substrate-binding protein [Thermomicrobiales bacterium]